MSSDNGSPSALLGVAAGGIRLASGEFRMIRCSSSTTGPDDVVAVTSLLQGRW